MKGLLLKDWYMIQKYCRSYILITAVIIGISIANGENLFFTFYPCMLCGMIPVTLLGYHFRCFSLLSTSLAASSGNYLYTTTSLSLASTRQHRQAAARCAASCSILFSAGKTCVRLSGGAGSSGEAQHFPGLHLYLLGLSACVSLFSTFLTTSAGSCFSSFSALRQRDSNAEMWARC